MQLARRGAKVYLGCRSESKAREAIARMRKASPGLGLEDRLVWLPLDLTLMSLVKKAAEEFLSKETRLDILGKGPVDNYTSVSLDSSRGISVQLITLASWPRTTSSPPKAYHIS